MRFRSILACLSMLAVVQVQAQAPAPARAVLTLAEQPLRLIRGAAVYKAPAGIAVQKDDILETGSHGAQVEAGPDAILALGPETRVLVLGLPAGGKTFDVALLQGWAKLMAGGGKLATPALQVSLAPGAAIVKSGGEGRDAVFAEDGVQHAARVAQGRPGTLLRLAPEQYAEADPAKPQPVTGRPPASFISAMPPAFRDRLARVPGLANAGKVAPVKEREAAFGDVEHWLTARLPGVQGFVPRFRARLADPAFRAPLERSLGQQRAWRAALYPAARPAAAGSQR